MAQKGAQITQDAFAERSTGTLRARVQALRLFQKWKGRVVPYDEEVVYRYMCHLRLSKAPPTRGKAFLEAALLLAAVANSDSLTLMAQSARLRGAAFSMLEHKKLRNQRDPLTLRQVKALEALVIDKSNPCEVAVLGHCLFALHSCARWSDLMALAEEPEIDDVVVMANSKRTKTSRGLKRLRVPIPFVGMSEGVSGRNWAATWLEARKKTGLTVDPSVRKLASNVAFGAEHMDATTASRHLRAFLVEAGCPAGQRQNIGAHSLKATLLSWSARWSMKASSRRILGKHSERKDHSMLTYSRDICIAALKDVALMFADIKCGKFDPDATRSIIVSSISGMVEANQTEDQVGEEQPDEDGDKDAENKLLPELPHEPEVTEEKDEASDDDVSDSDYFSDGEEDDILAMEPEIKDSECAMGDYLINPKSGCAHVALDRRFATACGVVGLGFAVHTTWDSAEAACEFFCKKCKP